ncbi:MAG TPA: hypothetical protein VGR35_00220 [Tepidisphaeraceae bacterium]|nr:hypothetical protein [Tepidisphaeraceae bacterium]
MVALIQDTVSTRHTPRVAGDESIGWDAPAPARTRTARPPAPRLYQCHALALLKLIDFAIAHVDSFSKLSGIVGHGGTEIDAVYKHLSAARASMLETADQTGDALAGFSNRDYRTATRESAQYDDYRPPNELGWIPDRF